MGAFVRELSVKDGKCFRAGALSTDKECNWEISDRPPIQLPMNPTLRDLAQIAVSYSSDEIERAGAGVPVAEAKEKTDALIRKASEVLEPLGATAEDVQALVVAKLKMS